MRTIEQVIERGATLALAPEHGARRHPATPIRLDRPLDLRTAAGTRLDVAGIAQLVRDAAGSLAALGVRRGDRVVVVKRNHLDIPLLASAVARLGALPVLLSSTLDPVAVAHLLERLDATLLVTDAATWRDGPLAELDRAQLPSTVALLDGSGAGTVAWPSPPATAPAMVPATALDEPALVTHTSGTTALPKLVVQSVGGLAEVIWLSVGRPRLLPVRGAVGAHLSFAHVRSNTGFASLLLTGWPLLALTDPDPDHVGALFEEVRPVIVETHPNTFVQWERLAGGAAGPLANVACFHSTFDAAHPRTVERLLGASRRRNPVYLQAYGQSETGPITVRPYTRWSLRGADGRCVGHAHAAYSRFRIANGRGRAGAYEEGLIEVRTRGRASTYLGQQELYDAKLGDGWWNMEDVGYRTRWGCLHLVDREIEQTAGIQSLLEIEDVLISRLPQLTEVVLIPAASGGAIPVVCTHDDAPLDRTRWGAAIRDVAPLAAPWHVAWKDLPRTATWKVRRLHVRDLIGEGRLQRIG